MIYVIALLITALAYLISLKIKGVFKHSLVNPVFISGILILVILKVIGLEVNEYKEGSKIITNFLNPLIVLLAVPLYRKRKMLIENALPILGGILVSITATFSIIAIMGKILKIDDILIATMLPKSITTPLAIEASAILKGIPSITVLSVVVTGIIGALLYDVVVRVFKIKTDLAKGIMLGATSHAIGTSKAIEVSDESGASSSLALGVSGIITVIIVVIISLFM